MNDWPYSKGFMKFGCLEPSKIMFIVISYPWIMGALAGSDNWALDNENGTMRSPVQKDICRKRAAALRRALNHPGTSDPQFLFHHSLTRLCKAEKLSMTPGSAMKVYMKNLTPFETKWGQWSILCCLTSFGHSSGIPPANAKSVPVSRRVKRWPRTSAWLGVPMLWPSPVLYLFPQHSHLCVCVRRAHN